MADEQKNVYSEITRYKCSRAYLYARDLDQRCDNCNEKVGDHPTTLSLRGVMAMLDGVVDEAKKKIVENYGSDEELMQRQVIAAELDVLKGK